METLQRYRWALTGLLILVLVGGGYLLWQPARSHPPPTPILVYTPTALPTAMPPPTPTPPPIKVYVSGAVVEPGVYTLPPDARVADALEAAGGPTAQADLVHINLARRVRDEEQIHVPCQGEPTPDLPPPPAAPTGDPPSGGGTGEKVNINTATVAELDTLPGIGPGYAQRIVDYRQSHGPFKTIEEVQNVSGIGPATFARIKELITVGG